MSAQASTYGDLLSDAVERLRAAGVLDPQRDARWLLRAAAGLQAAALSAALSSEASRQAAERFEDLIRQRERRRPVSHLLGRREFYGRSFRIDARALDPRPESEVLVEAALAHLSLDRPGRVLDLGVGSGCLLLTVLAENPLLHGVGVDQSAEALSLAAENAALLDPRSETPLTERLQLAQGDWLEGVEERFDAILCNPPYIALEDWAVLEPEVREHEPKAALTPGNDALAVYRSLASKIEARLTATGSAFFEVGRGQAPAVAKLFQEAGLQTQLLHDLGGVERVVAIRRRFGAVRAR